MCVKWGKCSILDPRSLFLNSSSNLFIRFFWNCTWWEALKSSFKLLFWIFKENSYYGQDRVNWPFWDQNSVEFSEIVSDSRHLKWVKLTVLFAERKNFLCPKLGKCVVFDPKINISDLSPKPNHQALKSE